MNTKAKEPDLLVQNKDVAVTEPAAPAVTPMHMLQMAIDRDADLDKLEQLMALQERWEANEARKAYVVALNAFKAEPLTLVKDKRTDFTSKRTGERTEYDYLTLPEAVRIIAPSLSKHGLSHSWATSQEEKVIIVTCTLTHEKGHSESVTLKAPPDDSGFKNPIQQISSTVSYLERYTLLAITGLAATGMDNDGGGMDETITDEQREQIEKMGDEIGIDWIAFYGWLGITTLADLPAAKFQKALNGIAEKKKQKGKSK